MKSHGILGRLGFPVSGCQMSECADLQQKNRQYLYAKHPQSVCVYICIRVRACVYIYICVCVYQTFVSKKPVVVEIALIKMLMWGVEMTLLKMKRGKSDEIESNSTHEHH